MFENCNLLVGDVGERDARGRRAVCKFEFGRQKAPHLLRFGRIGRGGLADVERPAKVVCGDTRELLAVAARWGLDVVQSERVAVVVNAVAARHKHRRYCVHGIVVDNRVRLLERPRVHARVVVVAIAFTRCPAISVSVRRVVWGSIAVVVQAVATNFRLWKHLTEARAPTNSAVLAHARAGLARANVLRSPCAEVTWLFLVILGASGTSGVRVTNTQRVVWSDFADAIGTREVRVAARRKVRNTGVACAIAVDEGVGFTPV